MATLADYIVIRDDPFEVGQTGSGPHSFDFELPTNYVADTGAGKPVLQFIYEVL